MSARQCFVQIWALNLRVKRKTERRREATFSSCSFLAATAAQYRKWRVFLWGNARSCVCVTAHTALVSLSACRSSTATKPCTIVAKPYSSADHARGRIIPYYHHRRPHFWCLAPSLAATRTHTPGQFVITPLHLVLADTAVRVLLASTCCESLENDKK